jgi:DNA ligase (NAD+)
LLHFVRREAMDIEGLGEALVDQLIDGGLVRSIPDVYDLRAEALAGLERMGERSAANLVEQVERSRTVPFERLIYALGIRFVGEKTALLLAGAFPSIEALQAATGEQLIEVHEVGERVAEAVRQFFDRQENRRLIERLKKAGVTLRGAPSRSVVSGPFSGKTCVVTGTIEGYARSRIREILRHQGARVVESVSKNTDVLIHGADPGSKLQRAERLGVRLVDAETFRRLVEGGGSTEESG